MVTALGWRQLAIGIMVGVICSITTVIALSSILGVSEHFIGARDLPIQWAVSGGVEELIRGFLAFFSLPIT